MWSAARPFYVLLCVGALTEGKILEQVLPSRGGSGRAPGPAPPAGEDVVYSTLCDHFVGTAPANNIQCANRCRAMFARRNGLETSLDKAAQKEGISVIDHALKLTKDKKSDKGSKSARLLTSVSEPRTEDYDMMTVTNSAFDSIVQRLAPDCAFQSYRLDETTGQPKSVDFCFSKYVLSNPDRLTDVSKKIHGSTIVNATSPANCQYQCQLDGDCFAWNFDTKDEQTCIFWPYKYAKKFSKKAGSLIGDHPCKPSPEEDGVKKIGNQSRCLKCNGVMTAAFDSKRYLSGTKYCASERQTMCELPTIPATISPFASMKARVKDSRKQTMKKYRWRHKGEDTWHSSDELIDHEGE